EALPRPAAARADDERRPFEAEVVVLCELRDLVGSECLGRLDSRLALLQERAAPRAVVRGLRVLEAALAAVDGCHLGSSRRPGAGPLMWASRPCPSGSR